MKTHQLPTFSVIIPLFNKQQHILQTLQSIFDQTYSDFEIVVVDDGSTDAGFELVKKCFNKANKAAHNLKLIQQRNAGVSSARNTGITHADGDVVVFTVEKSAARYRDFGGVVHYIGKPHQPIFQRCIKTLQENNIYPGQTIMVGASMAHDIWGGHLVNIDTCFVKAGLHASAFAKAHTPGDMDKALTILSNQYNNVRPNYMLHTMKWGNPLPDRKHKKRAGR